MSQQTSSQDEMDQAFDRACALQSEAHDLETSRRAQEAWEIYRQMEVAAGVATDNAGVRL